MPFSAFDTTGSLLKISDRLQVISFRGPTAASDFFDLVDDSVEIVHVDALDFRLADLITNVVLGLAESVFRSIPSIGMVLCTFDKVQNNFQIPLPSSYTRFVILNATVQKLPLSSAAYASSITISPTLNFGSGMSSSLLSVSLSCAMRCLFAGGSSFVADMVVVTAKTIEDFER